MAPPSAHRILSILLCSGLCLIFTCLAWSAAARGSATVDEPSHAIVGWFMLWRHDFRLSPDVPPLWEDWIALGMGDQLKYDPNDPQYRNLPVGVNPDAWFVRLLYSTQGNDGTALINRARAMSLAIAVLLAILIAKWAWDLAGPIAAIAAMFAYCFDPNFLGHGALAKNDIAAALMFAATAYAIWRAGKKLTWISGLSAPLLLAASAMVKFSGLLLVPVLVGLLAWRVLSPQPWIIFGQAIQSAWRKSLAAFLLCVTSAAITYLAIWACYDFRFNAGPDGMQLDIPTLVDRLRQNDLTMQWNHDPTPAESAAWRPALWTQVILSLADRELIPQAYAAGFLRTQLENVGHHRAYLLGHTYSGGKWSYFPIAMLLKEPLAMLLGFALTLPAILLAARSWLNSPQRRWAAAVLVVSAGIYGLAGITAQVNIGLRHIFPIYPFLFIAVGLGAAKLWHTKSGRIALSLLAIALAAEIASAYPHFIAYMNVAGRSIQPPPLIDSNLDWGQDLPLLAQWQQNHPDVTLYLDYFGHCDPKTDGIQYIPLADTRFFGRPTTLPTKPGTIAISATILFYDNGLPKLREMGIWPGRQPDKILGRTIYLFSYPPPARAGN